MSFSVSLQICYSEKNQINKSVGTIATINGTLRDSTSIVNPDILIEYDVANLAKCNYITIPTFGRSYFVTDITSVRSNLVQLSCHCDVLSSFKAGILRNQAIVRRQEHDWNLYINDGSFRVYQNPVVITKAFPHGFTTQEFVLAVAGS